VSASRPVRSRLVAVGAALAVLVTLVPAVGSAAVVEACPSDLPSTAFRDLGGLSSETIDAIECIFHYGITQGVSGTRFDPSGDVTRWQMALFLIRMADDLGIQVSSSVPNRFDDIRALPTDVQLAINQLADLGVTSGVAPGRFDPNAPVTRWQMALFLTRLHARSGYSLPDGRSQGFNDIGNYPAETQRAINQLAQLTISKGTSASTFTPAANVARWQMALFLSRQLRAGGATPYRISVTAEPAVSPTNGEVKLTVTVLTPAGAPVVGRSVDVFVGTLDANGRCVLSPNAKLGSGDAGTSTNCRIDNGDPKTNSSGKVTLTLTHNSVQEKNVVYAWIGRSDQVFDADEVAHVAKVEVNWTGVPTGTRRSLPGRALRLQGHRDRLAGRCAGQGRGCLRTDDRGDGPARQHPDHLPDSVTGSDGTFSFSYTGPSDPNPNQDNNPVVDTVKAFWDKNKNGKDDGSAEFDVTSTITWDDDEPRNDKAMLAQNTVSTLKGQSVSVTLTATDKFGMPLQGAAVTLIVTGANATSETKLTNNSGVASFSYATPNVGVDTIDATVDIGNDGSVEIGQGDVVDLTHYTVEVAGDPGGLDQLRHHRRQHLGEHDRRRRRREQLPPDLRLDQRSVQRGWQCRVAVDLPVGAGRSDAAGRRQRRRPDHQPLFGHHVRCVDLHPDHQVAPRTLGSFRRIRRNEPRVRPTRP
jgi:hypothetical protein